MLCCFFPGADPSPSSPELLAPASKLWGSVRLTWLLYNLKSMFVPAAISLRMPQRLGSVGWLQVAQRTFSSFVIVLGTTDLPLCKGLGFSGAAWCPLCLPGRGCLLSCLLSVSKIGISPSSGAGQLCRRLIPQAGVG